MKIRKNCTKALVKRMSDITNKLFRESVIDVMGVTDLSDENLSELIGLIRRSSFHAQINSSDIHHDDEWSKLSAKKELIDDMYLSKLIELPNQELSDILFLHGYGRPKRADRTIESITSELARRSLLNDSSQSDTIYSHGEVCAAAKSKRTRKKTTSKRHKASEDR